LPGQPEEATLADSGQPYWQSVARIGIQVAEALAYAHAQGTLHRDIKPSNLLLDTQGVVWVADFGLAKGTDSEDLTGSGDVVGTLRYMAPERFEGKADARSDLYALGLTLYELLTLRPSFDESERSQLLHQVMHLDPPRPRKVNPAVPRDLETIVLKAIARDPRHRYQSAGDLAADLERFMDDKPIQARPVSEVEKLWRWCRRNPALASLVATCALFLVVGVTGITWKWFEAERRRGEAESEREKVGRAEKETIVQRDRAVRTRNNSQRLLAGVLLDKGTALAEQGETVEGLFWMLEALKAVPEDDPHLERLIRTNLGGWLGQAPRLRRISEHPHSSWWCAFSRDGRRYVTGSDRKAQCWDTATGRAIGPPLNNERGGRPAFSPDGKLILTATNPAEGKPGVAQLWDAETGQARGPALPHPMEVHAAAFPPDGKRLATACGDGTVRLWDVATGQLLSDRFHHEQVEVRNLAISPDGRTLAAGTSVPRNQHAPAAAYLWDLAAGRQIGQPLPHQGGVHQVLFSPGGKSVLTCSWDGTARFWDAATGQPLGRPVKHPTANFSACFTPDGRTVVTGGNDGMVRWWDVGTSSQLTGTLHVSDEHVDVAISPDGRTLLPASLGVGQPGSVRVYDIARCLSRLAGKGKETILKTPSSPIQGTRYYERGSVAYNRDATRVLCGGSSGYARLGDAATGQPLAAPLPHPWQAVTVVAFDPTGRRVATASQDTTAIGGAQLWNATTGKPVGPPLPHINWVAAMAFSPDGKILATGGYDCCVQFWNAATGQRIGPPLVQTDIVLSLAFHPNGRTLAVGHAADYSGAHGTVLWDVSGRKAIGESMPGSGELVRYSPDGQRLLTAGGHSTRLWHASTGQPLSPAMSEASAVNSVAFRPDGQMFLVATVDGTLRLREAASGKPLGAPMLHPHPANVAIFSPDREGKLVLAGYADGSARLWDRATQKPVGPPVLQGRPLVGVAFAPDGGSFLTTANDGTTRCWPVPSALAGEPDRLARALQVHTGCEMGEGQTIVRLNPSEWEKRRLQVTGPAEAAVGDHAFHDARARDAEQDGDPFAARWHLDRMIATGGNGWLSHARRGRLATSEGRFDQAEADYARALKLSSPAQLLNWYRHRVSACRTTNQWPAALWYLNRAVAAASDDWQFYADRALVFGKLGKGEECKQDLEQAHQRGAPAEIAVQLGDVHASRGQWDRAATTYAQAGARGPCSPALGYRQALTCLKLGDAKGYREVCARLLQDAGPAPSPGLAHTVTWVCALGADAVANYTQPIALAELALRQAPPAAKPQALLALGAILYRAGRFKEAIARLNEGIAAGQGEGTMHDWVFLAMAHHRSGDADEARKCLDRIVLETSPAGLRWDYVQLHLLRREAQGLIKGGAEPPP
jgi:WD40 repeat protein/tetratricopeptide (TPR) repeat protein